MFQIYYTQTHNLLNPQDSKMSILMTADKSTDENPQLNSQHLSELHSIEQKEKY